MMDCAFNIKFAFQDGAALLSYAVSFGGIHKAQLSAGELALASFETNLSLTLGISHLIIGADYNS